MAVLTRLEICLIFIYSEDKNVNWTSVTLKPSLHFYIFKIYFFHCIWPCKLMYSLQICPGLSRVCDMTACRLCKMSWKHTRIDFLNSMCVYVQIAVRVVCLYVCLDDFFSCLFQQTRAALPRQAPDLVSLRKSLLSDILIGGFSGFLWPHLNVCWSLSFPHIC